MDGHSSNPVDKSSLSKDEGCGDTDMDGHSSNPVDKSTLSKDEDCGDKVQEALVVQPKNVVNIGDGTNFNAERDIIIAPTIYNVVINNKIEKSKPEENAAIDETKGCKEVELLIQVLDSYRNNILGGDVLENDTSITVDVTNFILGQLKETCESDEENIGTFSALPSNKIQELQSIHDYYVKLITKTDVVVGTNNNEKIITNLNNTGLIKIDFQGPVALVKSKHNILKEYFMAIEWSRESKSHWENHLLKLSQDQQLVVSTFMSAFLSKSKNKHSILLDVLANIVPEALHQEENKLDDLFSLLMEQPRDSLPESGKFEDVIIDGKYFSRNHQDILARLNKEARQKLQEQDFQNLWTSLNDKKSKKNEKSEAKFVLNKIPKGSSGDSPTFTIDVEGTGLRMNPISLTSEAIRSLLWFEDNVSGEFEYNYEHHFVCASKLPDALESRIRSILPLAKSITMIGEKPGDVVVGVYRPHGVFVLDEPLLNSLLNTTRLQTKSLEMSCIHLPNKKVGKLLASVPNITLNDIIISKEVLEEWANEIKRGHCIGRRLTLHKISLTLGTPESVSIILSNYRYLTLKYAFINNDHWPAWYTLMAAKYRENKTILEMLKIEGEKHAWIKGTSEEDSNMPYNSKIEKDNEDIIYKLRMFLSESQEKNMIEHLDNCNSDNLLRHCEFFMKQFKNQLPDNNNYEDIAVYGKKLSCNHQGILEKLIKKADKKLEVKEFKNLMKIVSDEETFVPKFSLCSHAKKSERKQGKGGLFRPFAQEHKITAPEYQVDIETKQGKRYPSIGLTSRAIQSLLWFENNLSGVFHFNNFIEFKCEKAVPEIMKAEMNHFLKQSREIEMVGEKTGDVIVGEYHHRADFIFDNSILQTLQHTILYHHLQKMSLSSIGLPGKEVGNLLGNIPDVSLSDIMVSPQLMDEWANTLKEKDLVGKKINLEKINLMLAKPESVSWVLASYRGLSLKYVFMTEVQWAQSAIEIRKAKMPNGLQVLESFSIEGRGKAYLRGDQRPEESWRDDVDKRFKKSVSEIQNLLSDYADVHRVAAMETRQKKVNTGWKSWFSWLK